MKCFIASAFGYSDVDALFDGAIRPVLLEKGVEALRVDRVEHNEDIDDKIMALMKEADFCIADLTYARPSVYYEAGFMKGSGKQVIFTSRSDHFRQTDNDPLGNLAVHFDLKMKNIIGWKKADSVFQAKLSARVQHVLTPLIKTADAEIKNKAERQAFARRSLADQMQVLRDAAVAVLKRAKFHPEGDELDSTRYFRLMESKRLVIFDVVVKRAFHKEDRQLLYQAHIRLPIEHTKEMASAKEVATIMVCVSPFAISRSPFRAYFSTYAENDMGALFREYPARKATGPYSSVVPKNAVTIEFLDRVGSESEFRSKFEQLLERAV